MDLKGLPTHLRTNTFSEYGSRVGCFLKRPTAQVENFHLRVDEARFEMQNDRVDSCMEEMW